MTQSGIPSRRHSQQIHWLVVTPYKNLEGGAQVARQLVAEAQRCGQPASLLSFDWDKPRSPGAFRFASSASRSLSAVRLLAASYRAERRVVVIAMGDSAAVHAIVARAVLLREWVPVISAQHQPYALSKVVRETPRLPAVARRLLAWIIDAVHNRSDAFVFLTEAQREAFLDREPAKLSTTTVIPNAARFPAAAQAEIQERIRRIRVGSELRILHAGAFSPRKNQSLAIRALALLPDARVRLSLAGPGDQSEVRSLAEKLNVLSRVRFLGEVEDMQSVYDEHDLLLSTALNESFGLTAIEGLIRGLLVVGPSEVPLFRDINERFPTVFGFRRYAPEDVATQIRIAVEAVRAEAVGLSQFVDAMDECEASFSVANFVAGHDATVRLIRSRRNGGQFRPRDSAGGTSVRE